MPAHLSKSNNDQLSGQKARLRGHAPDMQAEQTRSPEGYDSLAIGISKIDAASSTSAHAAALNRVTASQPARAGQSLLLLQRQYGNRYVQRVLDLARQGKGEAEASPEVEQIIQRARGSGQALDTGTRAAMESSFGADFSGVRVHADAESDTLNRALNARAFTTDQDVFSRQGAYRPGSYSGRELLAHELTHVVQQTGGELQRKITIGQLGDRYEPEADEVARAVIQQEQQPIRKDTDEGLAQRQVDEDEKEEPVQTKAEDFLVQWQLEPEGEEAPVQIQSGVGRTSVSLQRKKPTKQAPSVKRKWKDTPEQKAFLERVLNAHIARRARRRRQPLPDLSGAELAPVSGTNIEMRTEAAAAAGAMLSAANQALATAKKAGVPDALKTVRISATSGYRGRSHQERLWRRYFKRRKGYYDRTAKRRATLPGGEHGDAAVNFMVRYVSGKIAAPGFSNHQAGLAIDLWQQRTKGNRISNSTDSSAVNRWRRTWFFSWLQSNAATFQFEEYRREPWHWTFRGLKGGTRRASASSPEKLRVVSGTTSAEPSKPAVSGTTPEWLTRAVTRNNILGSRLGWISRVDDIVIHFQSLGHLPPLQTPNEETFAMAVRQYQAQYPGLGNDGIIGPNTWRQLRADMNGKGGGAGQQASRPTPPRIRGRGTASDEQSLKRQSHYKSQLENTFRRFKYIDKKTGKVKYYVDKSDMCNVTTLAMQLITLTGDENRLKEAVKDLLTKKGYRKPRTELDKITLADLIATLIYHKGRKPKEWRKRLKDTFPHIKWRRYRASKGDFILRGPILIVVGLEILEQVDITGKGERIAGEEIKKELEAGSDSAQRYFEERLLPKLNAGAVIMLSTILPGGGHYVYLNRIITDKGKEGGVVIDDPFGMKLLRYMKYGSRFRPRIMNKKRVQDILKRRVKYNPDLWNELQKLRKGDKFPKNIGEGNFYNWNEVSRYMIGRSANIISVAS